MILKKITLTVSLFAMAMLILSGCSANNAAPKETAAQETSDMVVAEPGGAFDKVSDPEAEVSFPCSVFVVNSKGNGLVQEMDEIADEHPLLVFEKLVEYDVLDENAVLEDYTETDGKGVLKISGIENADLEDRLRDAAIVNTFTQNFELDSLTLIINGKTVVEDQAFIKNYKELN